MRCSICKREDSEVDLLEGISPRGMVRICISCSEVEGMPTIKKPTNEQIATLKDSRSVRQRMEDLSGPRKRTDISQEQTVVQRNLSRLRMPEKKQYHEEVLDDYYWTLNMARRRQKLTLSQLSERVGIDVNVLASIERGKIPKDFGEIFLKLESFFNVRFLKNHNAKVKFSRIVDEEKRILSAVQKKIEHSDTDEDDNFLKEVQEKREILRGIEKEDTNFPKRDKFENVTLSDLVDMKKEREQKARRRRTKIQTDAMISDEIELGLELGDEELS